MTLLLCGLTILASSAALCEPVTAQLAALNAVCRSAIDSGDLDIALRLCKRVSFDARKLAPGSQEHIASIVNLGDIKSLVESYVDADAYYAAALTLVERAAGADSPRAAELLALMVETKVKRGKFLDAEVLMQRLLALREKAAGARDPQVAIVMARYADLLSQSHQFPEAELAYGHAIGVLERAGPESTEAYLLAVQHLAEMYERRSQYVQAQVQYRRLLEIVERRALGEAARAMPLDRLAHLCEDRQEWSAAVELYRNEMHVLVAINAPVELITKVREKLAELESTQRQSTP